MMAAAFRARHVLVAMSFALLLALALMLAAPVGAQEETTAQLDNEAQAVSKDENASGKQEQSVQGSGQQAEESEEEAGAPTTARATDSLQEATVTIESSGGTLDRIEIDAADCVVDKGATVTVVDGDDNPQTFTNIGDVTAEGSANIEATEGQVLVTDIEDGLNNGFGTSNTGEVTDSSDITCGRDDNGNDNAGGDGNGNSGDDSNTADDLKDLSCDDLLVLFRAEGGAQRQYGNASGFADSGVRAQVEVCLENEIVQGTAADGDLPDTGGLSLIGLAVLGVASAAAVLSVIRGGRR